MPSHDKNHQDKYAKSALEVAARLTIAAIQHGSAMPSTPEGIADFYLAMARRIIDAPVNGDSD